MASFETYDSWLKNAGESWSYSKTGDTMRFEVRDGDYWDSPVAEPEAEDVYLGKNRSEISSFRSMQNNRAFTLEFEFMVEQGAPNTADWLSLVQMHQTEDKAADGTPIDGIAGVPFSMGLRGETLTFVGRTDSRVATIDTPPAIPLNGFVDMMHAETLQRDHWYDMKFEMVWDHEIGGDGLLNVWLDSTQIIQYRGPLGYNDMVGPYLQLGVYRAKTTETTAAQYRGVSITGEGTPPPMEGTAGDDVIVANARGFWEGETLYGGAGNDTLDGGWGADTMYGGTGDDTYVVERVTDVVSEENGSGTDLVRSYVTYTLGDGLENLLLWDGADADPHADATGNGLDNTITGNMGDNVLMGMGGADYVLGGGGDDKAYGGAGDDQVYGAAGKDTLWGDDGNDRLFGETDDDVLYGGAGDDILEGDGGTDTLYGGAGNDQYVIDTAGDIVVETAGGGIDTVRVSVDFDAGAGNDIEIINTTDQAGTAAIAIWGTDGDNEIRGNNGANTLNGRGGSDMLQGNGGIDRLIGDAGDDTLYGGSGDDLLEGGDGADFLQGGSGADTLYAGAGTDTLYGDGGDDLLEGGEQADILQGGSDNDTLRGNGGDDTLYGQAGTDLLEGGDGVDNLYGGAGDDTVDGGAGDDMLYGGAGNDRLVGGAGDDTYLVEQAGDTVTEAAGGGTDTVRTTVSFALGDLEIEVLKAANQSATEAMNLTGSDIDNEMRANAGDNILDGRGGADAMYGFQGDDTYFVDNAGDRVNEWAGNGRDTVSTSVNFNLSNSNYVEVVFSSGTGLTLTGNDHDNTITGDDGANWITGGGGDDVITGGKGNDTLYGGAGTDTLIFDTDSTDVSASASANTMQLTSSEGVEFISADVEFFRFNDKTLTWAEVAQLSSPTAPTLIEGEETVDDRLSSGDNGDTISGLGGNDTLYGGGGDDTLLGGTGDDNLNAGAGDDTLDGGTGADRMYGYGGDDLYIVDEAGDRVYEGANAGQDTVRTAIAFNIGDDMHVEELVSTGSGLTLGGNDLANTITGDDGKNWIQGRGGDDLITTGDGDDVVYGGAGTDTLVLNVASTATSASAGAGSMVLTSAEGADFIVDDVEFIRFTDTTLTWAQASQLTGAPATDVITGNDTAEGLVGTAGAETIHGNGGGDWITPGAGSDSVDGGDGVDMISFVDLGQRVAVSLSGGEATSGDDTNRIANVENITGSIYSDLIEGDAGDNYLRGMGGYDWFIGSDGADSYEGSNGRDMISYVFATERVGIDLEQQKGLFGQAGGDVYDSIERATGSSWADLFYGSGGEDEMRGMGGYDWFMSSGGGRDRYDGGSGRDTVSYAFAGEGVTASLSLGYGSRGEAARDLYTSIENLTGTNFDDILTGDNERNILRGQYGRDILYGNGGTDYLTGGGSDDVLYGGDGWDVAVYEGNKADYTVFTAGNLTSVTYNPGGGDGMDLVLEVEALSFADGMIYL